MKKSILIVIAILAMAGIGLWWTFGSEAAGDETRLLGNVDIRQVSLAFNGSGRVIEVMVEEGARVKAGDILATLDTQSLQLQAAQARAQIEVQRQVLARLHNGARPEEVLQAQSAVTAASADAERAAQELQRLQGIAAATDGRGVSAQELERAQTAAEVGASALEQQRQRLELVEQGPRSEEIAGAEAQLQAFQAQLDLLQYQIEQGTLTAPVDAMVRSRLIEVGDMATPQRAAFSLALTDPKWVRVFASETQLGRIHPGMAVEVVTDSHPDQPISGSVGFISSVAEFTPKSVQTEELRTSLVYEVRVTVEDPQNRLRLGQPVTVRMTASTAQ